MKFLLIEDNEEKANSVQNYILSLLKFSEAEFEIKTNYLDGKRALRGAYDFLILDMTLPLDDTSIDNKISTAGMDILEIMKHRKLIKPCVVLTQYDTFGKHQNKVNLDSLSNDVTKEYGEIVKQVIYYASKDGDWREKLKLVIEEVA
jgi:hypothetical protein